MTPRDPDICRATHRPIHLAIIIPCYNEEDVLPDTIVKLDHLCTQLIDDNIIKAESRIILIDDGSDDTTWSIITSQNQTGLRISGIRLSRNFGHQNALICGLNEVNADAIITIDADLQDDITTIPEMLSAYRDGADIVFGVRAHRSSDSIFKRFSAISYYHFLRMLGVNTVYNHADFRLMSARAVEALRNFGEVNIYLRGVVPLLGFKTRTIHYDRKARQQGTSKYPLPRMLALALEGVTSFSVRPLRWITLMGAILSASSIIAGIWALSVRLVGGNFVPGWASTVIPLYFLGGLQLLSLGIIGEYLGKIYLETKHRPRFIIAEKSDNISLSRETI